MLGVTVVYSATITVIVYPTTSLLRVSVTVVGKAIHVRLVSPRSSALLMELVIVPMRERVPVMRVTLA